MKKSGMYFLIALVLILVAIIVGSIVSTADGDVGVIVPLGVIAIFAIVIIAGWVAKKGFEASNEEKRLGF